MRNRTTTIRFPVFNGYEVRVICARDLAATGRRLKEDFTGAEACFVYKDEHPAMSWIVFSPKAEPDTIAHEASHAVRHLFKFSGAAEDDEAFAYHLAYLVGRIHKFLKGRK